MADSEPRGRGRGRGAPRGRGRGGMKRPMSDAQDYEDFSDGFTKKRKIMDDVYRFIVREDPREDCYRKRWRTHQIH